MLYALVHSWSTATIAVAFAGADAVSFGLKITVKLQHAMAWMPGRYKKQVTTAK